MIGAKDADTEAADAADPGAADTTTNNTAEDGSAQKSGWSDPLVVVSFTLSILVFVKNVTTWTIFVLRRFIEQREDVALRPQSYATVQAAPKLDKESKNAMRAYL